MFHLYVLPMRCIRNLVILFAFSITIVSGQPGKLHEMSTQSARVSLFEQRLDMRVERFDTSGRTLVACLVDLAFAYQLPTAIEYADRDATTRALNLQFHNESVRGILETCSHAFPGIHLILELSRYADFTLLIAVCRHQITSVSDHVPGIVPVTVGNTQNATNEFRPVLARYQSTSWNRSRFRF